MSYWQYQVYFFIDTLSAGGHYNRAHSPTHLPVGQEAETFLSMLSIHNKKKYAPSAAPSKIINQKTPNFEAVKQI